MASGEAPFLPTTLGLVYDKLVEKAFPKHTPSGLGAENTIDWSASPIPRASNFASAVAPPSTSTVASSSVVGLASSANLQPPAPTPGTPWGTVELARLRCARCRQISPIDELDDGLYCPHCPPTGKNGKGQKGKPFMRCTECATLRDRHVDVCSKSKCRAQFDSDDGGRSSDPDAGW